MKIKPGKIGIIRELEFISIVFQDVDEIKYFQIQDAFKYDEQDIRLGMDKYYIELNDQKFGCYGGIEKIHIDKSRLIINLNSRQKDVFNFSSITIEIKESEFKSIEKELVKILLKHKIEIEKESKLGKNSK